MTTTGLAPLAETDLVAVVLRPSRRKWLGIFVLCLGFVALGAVLCRDGDPSDRWIGWLSVIFFGGGGIVVVPQIFSRRAHLRLDADGFSFATLRRRSDYNWAEITAPFAAVRVSRIKLVMFNTARPPSRTSTLNQGFCGYDYGLPDTYGMKAEDLAALMTRFWLRARNT
jgi:hypothetical protein